MNLPPLPKSSLLLKGRVAAVRALSIKSSSSTNLVVSRRRFSSFITLDKALVRDPPSSVAVVFCKSWLQKDLLAKSFWTNFDLQVELLLLLLGPFGSGDSSAESLEVAFRSWRVPDVEGIGESKVESWNVIFIIFNKIIFTMALLPVRALKVWD